MYSLLVIYRFEDWEGGTFRFTKDRFLEYTSAAITEQLRLLSTEARECIGSWPCLLMEEGRGEERVHIGQISEILDLGTEVEIMIDLRPMIQLKFESSVRCISLKLSAIMTQNG